MYVHSYEHSPISMAIFYERVPYAPYIWNSLKMTVEWLHNRCYIKKEALLSFYNVCCSTFELCFRKKNIFSSYYNTIMIFFLEILRRNPLSKFWPKIIPLRTSCRRDTSRLWNLTYIGLKVAGNLPATFKPIFKAIAFWEDVRRHDVRRGSSVPISGA